MTVAAAIGIPLLSPDRGPRRHGDRRGRGRRSARLGARRRAPCANRGDARRVGAHGGRRRAPLSRPHGTRAGRARTRVRADSDHGPRAPRTGSPLYMEANGTFSLVEDKRPGVGLSLLPASDDDLRQLQPPEPGAFACRRCGEVVRCERAHTCASSAVTRMQSLRYRPLRMVERHRRHERLAETCPAAVMPRRRNSRQSSLRRRVCIVSTRAVLCSAALRAARAICLAESSR